MRPVRYLVPLLSIVMLAARVGIGTGGGPSVCGNGVVEFGEECDGGNDTACPGECSPLCICFVPAPVATATPVLDHFQCYEAHARRHVVPGVSLVDAFGPSTVELIEPHRLCAPASKNNEDSMAPTHAAHLDGFRMRQTSPRFKRIRGLAVTNQFGTIDIDVVRPDYLLVPSSKSLGGPPPALADGVLDHFKCYSVRGRKRVADVAVEDQFGTLSVALKRPERLCVAADKNGEGFVDRTASLLCFEARRGTMGGFVPPGTVFVNDQFGQDSYDLFRPTELCVPSRFTLVTPTPTVTATPVLTSTPVLTGTPVPTSTPVETSTPPDTATATPTAPTATPTDATSTPVETSTPIVTATPIETSTPVVTATPIETSTPADAPTPNDTSTPVETETPVATPTPIPCTYDQNAQSCGSDCPPGFECSETSPASCECVPLPPCGLDAGVCGGACPNLTDACLYDPVGGTCVCVPPEEGCAGDGATCAGLCPVVTDDCVPSQVDPGMCECGGIQ